MWEIKKVEELVFIIGANGICVEKEREDEAKEYERSAEFSVDLQFLEEWIG